MKLSKISLVAAVVLGGMLACSQLALAQDAGTNTNRKGKGRFSVEQRLARMDKELSLTDEQKPKVKAVLEDTSKKMAEVRDLPQDERGPKFRELRTAENKKLKEILTADQYKKYEEAMQRRGKNGKRGGQGSQSGSSSSQ